MNIKKIGVLFLCFTVLLLFPQSTFAKTSSLNTSKKCNCNDADFDSLSLALQEEGYTELTNKDIRDKLSHIQKNKNYKELLDWLKENKLKLKNKNAFGLNLPEQIINNILYSNVDFIGITIESNKNNNSINGFGVVYIYLDSSGGIIDLYSQFFYNFDTITGEFAYSQTYTLENGFTEKITFEDYNELIINGDELTTQDAFACSLVGVYTCTKTCWLFSAWLGGVAGIVCGMVCGISFIYLCSR